MTHQEAAYWNAKYPRFYLSRWSKSQGRRICVGKGFADIRSALKAASRRDLRNPGEFTFIDVPADRSK